MSELPSNNPVTSIRPDIPNLDQMQRRMLGSHEKGQLRTESGELQTEQKLQEFIKTLKVDEEKYLESKKIRATRLDGYSKDPRVQATYVLEQLAELSKNNGHEYQTLQTEKVKPFEEEDKAEILKILDAQIEKLFSKGYENKREIVRNEVRRYAELLLKAKSERTSGDKITNEVVLKKLQEVVAVLALQDRAASENLLGDHGVRHLVEHNIQVSERVLDELEKNGAKISAYDRLIAHEIMIYHDLGYAVEPVRSDINDEGINGQDAGHNLIGAVFYRSRFDVLSDDVNTRIFSNKSDIERIHWGILTHDEPKFTLTFDNSESSNKQNVEAAVRIADCTHAFETKLPELLFSFPETLEYLQLLKIATESKVYEGPELEETTAQIIDKLNNTIDSREGLSEDEKTSLKMASRRLQGKSFERTVPRICGKNPIITINSLEGRPSLEIAVEESEIHQIIISLFNLKDYDQFIKMCKDLGITKEDIEKAGVQTTEGEVEVSDNAKRLIIKLIKDRSKSKESIESGSKSDYAQKVEELVLKNDGLAGLISAFENVRDLGDQRTIEDTIRFKTILKGYIDSKK